MKKIIKTVLITMCVLALASCQQPNSPTEPIDEAALQEKLLREKARNFYNRCFLNKTFVNKIKYDTDPRYKDSYEDWYTENIKKIKFLENTIEYTFFNGTNEIKEISDIYIKTDDCFESGKIIKDLFIIKFKNDYDYQKRMLTKDRNGTVFNYNENIVTEVYYAYTGTASHRDTFVLDTSSSGNESGDVSSVTGTYSFNNATGSQVNGSFTLSSDGNWTYSGTKTKCPQNGTYSISGNTITFNWTYGGSNWTDSFTISENGSNVTFNCTNTSNSLFLNTLFGVAPPQSTLTLEKSN